MRNGRAFSRGIANCRFVRDDVRALAQPTGGADVIVVSRLFTILPERALALAEMHRVPWGGGRCFVARPWTAIPLRVLWLLAGLARLGSRGRGDYREPSSVTVLTVEESGALL